MKEKDLMLNGYLYKVFDDEINQMFKIRCKFLEEFNTTSYDDFKSRENLVKKYFKSVGNNITINKPFYCDYGSNITIGDNFYANFDCIFLDVCSITIKDNVMLGPRVSIFTAAHPIDKDVRNEQLEFGKPVVIGNNVWIGGNTVINPGVTIGDDTVIGSGSVVTKDIPSGVVACGNPCRVIREISLKDKEYWQSKKEEYILNKK